MSFLEGSSTRTVVRLRSWADDKFRLHVMNAINLLIWKGMLHRETSYSLIYKSALGIIEGQDPQSGEWLTGPGRPFVRTVLHFEGQREAIPESILDFDPLDIITAAGSLKLVEGKSDSL